MVEKPIAHEISTQATITSQSIQIIRTDRWSDGIQVLKAFSMSHSRMVWHFQTIGHVAGEAHIQNGSLYSLVLHDVNHPCNQRARFPGKGRARFENHPQMRIALMKSLQGIDKQFHIIALSRHQMSSAEVNPLKLRKPRRKLIFYVLKGAGKGICTTFAMAVNMKAVDASRQFRWQLRCQYPEPTSWSTGIIQLRFNL